MTRPVMERPNLDELLAALKGFQRATVQRVFQRMYLDPEPTTRFLVADEVGLGKTLVARGVIAHVVNHLWDERKHLNVLYICSNQAIAAQNLSKLAIAEGQRTTATRLTLLPRDIHQLRENKLNFISLTPGTALDLRSQGGRCGLR